MQTGARARSKNLQAFGDEWMDGEGRGVDVEGQNNTQKRLNAERNRVRIAALLETSFPPHRSAVS